MMVQAILLTADKHLARLVKEALEGLPVKLVAECGHIKTALDVFREQPVQLVIADLFLPESSGIDAMKTLKKVDESLAIILLSRMHGRTLLERAFRHGASDVLIYPVPAETIRQTVMHRLEQLDDGMVHFT